MIAVVDADSFYASCERVFNPRLHGRAVIVLSNNDGCVVARSTEAKRLGIGMGDPYFQIAGLCRQHGVEVFSSNYSLYGDMSARLIEVLGMHAPAKVEVYSIDEAFLEGLPLAGVGEAMRDLARTVRRWTGLPVSIGCAPTRTLSKVAVDLSKKQDERVCVLHHESPATAAILDGLEVEEVWGISDGFGHRLRSHGVFTAAQLAAAPLPWVRRVLGVTGARIALELRGVRCIAPEDDPPRRTCCHSRSFGEPVTTRRELREAVADYASRTAEKIRRWGRVAEVVQVFAHTSFFRATHAHYSGSACVRLAEPTSFTPALVGAALEALARVWRPGCAFAKAGVILHGLSLPDHVQPALPGVIGPAQPPGEREDRLMRAMDTVNRTHGRGTVQIAAAGLQRRWSAKATRRSPRYTTQIRELPRVRVSAPVRSAAHSACVEWKPATFSLPLFGKLAVPEA